MRGYAPYRWGDWCCDCGVPWAAECARRRRAKRRNHVFCDLDYAPPCQYPDNVVDASRFAFSSSPSAPSRQVSYAG